MHFFCNLHHVPSSTSPNCITMTSSVIFICFSLCFMSQIYSTELPIDWGSLSHSLEPFSCVLYVYVFAYVYVCVRRCCEYFNQSEVQLQTWNCYLQVVVQVWLPVSPSSMDIPLSVRLSCLYCTSLMEHWSSTRPLPLWSFLFFCPRILCGEWVCKRYMYMEGCVCVCWACGGMWGWTYVGVCVHVWHFIGARCL